MITKIKINQFLELNFKLHLKIFIKDFIIIFLNNNYFILNKNKYIKRYYNEVMYI